MDKDQFLQPEVESYEFINERDAQIASRSDSTDAGTPLSDAEKSLADRVRHLQQDNKELRKVIDNYQKALQLYQNSLNSAIAREGEILSDTQEKYNQAKSKVERQNEKILNLEKELEEEKNKHFKNEEAILDEKQQNEKNDCEKADVSEKNNFEEKVCSLRQLVDTLCVLTPDECKTSMSSDHFQDLINLSRDMEKFIKTILKFDSAAPDRENTFEDELKSLQEQLKREEQKRAELETTNKKLQDLVDKKLEGVDMKGLQEEIQLLDKDMNKIDMLRAGYVSRDSQTTEESFCLHQAGQQQQSNDNSISLKFEQEKEQLQKKVRILENERRQMSKRENKFLEDKEKLLSELDSSNAKVEEMKAKLAVKADESQLAAAIAGKAEIEEELKRFRGINESLEIKLKENYSQLEQLSKNENVLKAQVYSLCQEIENKDERLDLSVTECDKMNSALDEMRKELDAVYSQNEKLLTERKGADEAEIVELRSKIDNLTAQLLSAEEMLDHNETDLRKAREEKKSLASELETVPLLKEQFDVFQADFNTERQTRQKVEEDNRKLRDEVAKLRADNERLTEEAIDPTGSRLAEMQRRHGCGSVSQPGNDNSPWSGFYDQFLAPRGPAVARNGSHHPHGENDVNRQVSGGRCPKCDLMFPDLDTLQTHVVGCLESESTGSVEGRICPKCQGAFPDLDTLQIHVMECLDN